MTSLAYDTALSYLRNSVKNGTAKTLTLAEAKTLIGRRIRIIYFGYAGQDGIDEFIIGGISNQLAYADKCPMNNWSSMGAYWRSYMNATQLASYENTLILLDNCGNDTCIYCHDEGFFNELTFTCSDSDRQVYYISYK